MIGNVALLSIVMIERFLVVAKCRIRGVVNLVGPSGVLGGGDICSQVQTLFAVLIHVGATIYRYHCQTLRF